MNAIVGVKALGTNIVVEHLSAQEIANTVISLGYNAKAECPQAVILDIGPALKSAGTDWGFKVGDRVLLQGSFVPVPNFRGSGSRPMGIVAPHDIKCVLEEACDQ